MQQMIVKEKQTDIAILRTLGAAPGNVLKMFVVQGAIIGLVGTVAGALLGCVLAVNFLSILHFIEHTFDASRNPAQWAVAGFSMGGTCALDLVVEHPSTFTHFVDISGDLAPNSGDPAQTLADLYGGNVAAEHANEPLLVMHAHGRYRGVSGLFLTSTAEPRHQREAEELSQAAAKVDIWSQVEVSPGSHVWQFAGPAFATAYPWLASQLAATPAHREARSPKPA